MSGISGSYSHYANTSFCEIPYDEESVGDPPTPPVIPNQPGVKSTTTQQTEVANYIDAVKAYLDGEGHTDYDAQLTGLKSYTNNMDWISEQNLYFLVAVAQWLAGNPKTDATDSTEAQRDALANYAGQVREYTAHLAEVGTITAYSADQLTTAVGDEADKIALAASYPNENEYVIFAAIAADSNPPPSTADEKQASTIYTEAQTKTQEYLNFTRTKVTQVYNGFPTLISSDETAADLWLGKASSSTDPQAVTDRINQAKALLQTAQTNITGLNDFMNAVNQQVSDANTRLEAIKTDIATISSHPSDHAANTPLLADMQEKEGQIITVNDQLYQVLRARLGNITKDIYDAETLIINTRGQYFPNDKPPAIQPGMMYLDVSYLKPNGTSVTTAQMDAYLSSLKAARCDTIILNFVMLSDVDKLATHTAVTNPWADAWNDGTIEKFTAQAQDANFKIWYSFGGVSVPADGYNLNGDPAALGKSFGEYVQKLKLTGVDFDLESTCVQTDAYPKYPTPAQWYTFLGALRQQVSSWGGKLSFTTLADPGQFAKFAYNDPTNHPFFNTFDEFNPETYDGGDVGTDGTIQGHYYLAESYFTQWAQYMKPNPSGGYMKHMHVGFFDTPLSNIVAKKGPYIPYLEGSGGDAPISASSAGQAAAMRYITDSLKNGANTFGSVYFWPDEATAYPPSKGFPGTDFQKDFFTEYARWNWLHNTTTYDNHNTFWTTVSSWLPWNWGAAA